MAAAARKLAVNVVVRNPETGQPEVLEEGSTPPAWAAGELGDHVFEGGESKSSGSK